MEHECHGDSNFNFVLGEKIPKGLVKRVEAIKKYVQFESIQNIALLRSAKIMKIVE